jgi:hypothetical protein
MSFCPFNKFNKIFGTPGKGAHSFRLLHSALVDYVLTLVGAILIAYLTNIPVVLTTISLFIIGIIIHILFGIPTEAVKYLGLAC